MKVRSTALVICLAFCLGLPSIPGTASAQTDGEKGGPGAGAGSGAPPYPGQPTRPTQPPPTVKPAQPAQPTGTPNRALAVEWNRKGLRTRDYQQKVLFYTKTIQADPTWHIGWGNRCFALHKLGRNQKALPDCNKAIQINPRFYQNWFTRARVQAAMKNFQPALGDYSKTIELKPNHYVAWNNRGYCYERLGDLQR
ncbi:MAG: tetratricopeptide repeat protein, partial [Proteobacteria bacterium]|nr:tetratricopeptide repeat protein [Pseudomonadota bacterium]